MRLSRKNKQDINLKGTEELFDVIDDHIKKTFRINDDEYDYLCEVMTDEDLDFFVKNPTTFSERRRLLTILEGYLGERKIIYKELKKEFSEAVDKKMAGYLCVGEIKGKFK